MRRLLRGARTGDVDGPSVGGHRVRTPNRETGDRWVFRSFDDLHHDLTDWLPRLPRVAAVCGVPRSGVLVASMLATMLNVPLLSLDQLMVGSDSTWRPAASKPLPPPSGQRILVVDDSVWSGGTMAKAREQLPPEIRDRCVFGAPYVNIESAHKLDCVGYRLDSIQHLFGWNFLRDMHARTTLTDMDGVLCDDWPGDVSDENAAEYQCFLEAVSPRIKPIYPVLGIVTGRCATHRAKTEAWLARHGIKSQALYMPFADASVRRGQCVGTAKAAIYAEHSAATLFVESDLAQARVIFQRTGKPVLCSDALEFFQ